MGYFKLNIVFSTNKFFLSMQCYMRALFSYNPSEDTLLPCRDIGLPFKSGDILQVDLQLKVFKVKLDTFFRFRSSMSRIPTGGKQRT